MAFERFFTALVAAAGTERHIGGGATLRIKCGRPHLTREIRTSGLMSGDGKQGDAERSWQGCDQGSDDSYQAASATTMWALARLGQHVSADVLRLAIALLEIQRRQKLASYQGLIGIVLVTENHGVGGSIPPLGIIFSKT